jgi:hypothetical protein
MRWGKDIHKKGLSDAKAGHTCPLEVKKRYEKWLM